MFDTQNASAVGRRPVAPSDRRPTPERGVRSIQSFTRAPRKTPITVLYAPHRRPPGVGTLAHLERRARATPTPTAAMAASPNAAE